MERWLPISGYPNYQVSDMGRFRNVKLGNLLSPITVSKGYKAVRLYHNRVGKTLKAHRLVALHFLPNPLNLPEVNHKDEDKANNSLPNLEWMTTADNVEYSHAGCYVYRNPNGVPVHIFNLSKFCREHGLTQGSMSTVKNGKAKSHKGWTYLPSDNHPV